MTVNELFDGRRDYLNGYIVNYDGKDLGILKEIREFTHFNAKKELDGKEYIFDLVPITPITKQFLPGYKTVTLTAIGTKPGGKYRKSRKRGRKGRKSRKGRK